MLISSLYNNVRRCEFSTSVAPAGLDDHVAVALEDDVGVVVEVEDGDGGELGGGTAGFGDHVGVEEVDQGLYDGVVGGVHVGPQGEGALPCAVEGGVAVRGDDPVLATQVWHGINTLYAIC